jgi:hypothetical protein
MVDSDTNLMANLGQSFKAFVQFEDPDVGGNFLRLKSIQTVTVQYDFTDEDRYNDSGILSLVRTGQNHLVTINLILTAEEIDTVDPPTDKSTVSWFLFQKFILERIKLFVRETFVTEGVTPATLRNEFTMDVQGVGTVRNVGGAIELPINGRILDEPRPTFVKT